MKCLLLLVYSLKKAKEASEGIASFDRCLVRPREGLALKFNLQLNLSLLIANTIRDIPLSSPPRKKDSSIRIPHLRMV